MGRTWAGDPKGTAEDPARCIAEVYPGAAAHTWIPHQCRRKRGHGPGGLFCKQHGKKQQELMDRVHDVFTAEVFPRG